MARLEHIVARTTTTAVVVAVVGVFPASWTAHSEPTRAALAVVLQSYAAPAVLLRSYGLSVIDVPELPPPVNRGQDPATRAQGLVQGCPVEVRAIVMSDDGASSFAVIASGDESTVLHSGEGVRVGNSFVAVSEINPDHLNLRRGTATYRCGLRRATTR